MTETTDSGRKLFFGLFVFPLLIAIGMAVLLCSVVLMTHEDSTPESLIVALKTSSPSKRWQKAFELSNEINRQPGKKQSALVTREMIQILRDGEHFDAKTRGYMAIALSHQDSDEVLSALKQTLSDSEEELRLYTMWSLGVLGRREVVPDIEALLADESPAIRKTAAYVLGALTSKDSDEKLRRLLNDPIADVRWNAALSLARIGNTGGRDVLLSMLERDKLAADLHMDEQQVEAAMVNASKGLALIPDAESIKILQNISKADKNLKVRQAALTALQHMEKISS